MPIQKYQMHRLMRIAAMLKENRYPNSETLVREFRRIALEEELEIDCGKKTILRDMKALEEEFGCPLGFDRARNGYYLKHHGWDFIAPAILDENEMLAAVSLTARTGKDPAENSRFGTTNRGNRDTHPLFLRSTAGRSCRSQTD